MNCKKAIVGFLLSIFVESVFAEKRPCAIQCEGYSPVIVTHLCPEDDSYRCNNQGENAKRWLNDEYKKCCFGLEIDEDRFRDWKLEYKWRFDKEAPELLTPMDLSLTVPYHCKPEGWYYYN